MSWPPTVNHGATDQPRACPILVCRSRGQIIHSLSHLRTSQVSISVYDARSVTIVIESHESERMTRPGLEGIKTADTLVLDPELAQ